MLESPILTIHIIAGMIAFFVGPGAMLTKKGKVWHRRWGKIFFWSMTVVAISAVILTIRNQSVFLALVGIFSFYSAFSGYRVLYQKRPDRGQTATPLDWIAAGITVASGLGLLYLGIFRFGALQLNFNVVMIVFGVIALLLGGSDIRRFRSSFNPETDRYNWLFIHMGNMMGAYIAAVTAFSATNFGFLPIVVRWLWPGVVFGILGNYWTRKYRKQYATSGKTAAAASEQNVAI